MLPVKIFLKRRGCGHAGQYTKSDGRHEELVDLQNFELMGSETTTYAGHLINQRAGQMMSPRPSALGRWSAHTIYPLCEPSLSRKFF